MLFETAEHLAREGELAQKIEQVFSCQFHKLPIHHKLDAYLSRQGQGVAVCELKCREVPHDKYPTLVMSEDKLLTGLKLCRYFINWSSHKSIALMLFIRYLDGDYYTRVNSIIGFRKELLDPKNHDRFIDQEMVVHIPKEMLKPF